MAEKDRYSDGEIKCGEAGELLFNLGAVVIGLRQKSLEDLERTWCILREWECRVKVVGGGVIQGTLSNQLYRPKFRARTSRCVQWRDGDEDGDGTIDGELRNQGGE